MCGIYGVLSESGARVDAAVVRTMGATMMHRGPDGEGIYADGPLHMGMKRLAIIDVDGGQQPLFSEDRNVVVVCNGEIYNFRELRESLIRRGHTFATGSDSEVVAHLYEDYGEDCVSHLSGMFAIAIWDRTRRRLLLARDRLGIKPLYVARSGGRLIFASEQKSILTCPGVERQIDSDALQEYLALGYVPAPLTMFRGIRKLQPGTLLVVEDGQERCRTYWDFSRERIEVRDENEWAERIRSTVEHSVVSQMVSDVPLGAFLSGGIDSSAVVACMARNSERPVKTYSIGFDTDSGGAYYNELPYARQVSELFATDHHEIVVRPDVTRLLPELLWHMDEPIADAAFITTYLVSKFAREDVTVILSGVGGDELFGGYRRYWSERLARVYRKIPRPLRRSLLQPMARALPGDRHSRVYDWLRLAKGFMAGAELDADERYEQYVRVYDRSDLASILGESEVNRSAALRSAFAAATDSDPLSRIIEVDLRTQLPDDLLMLTDRMSMATSLECRVPLLDDGLVELASVLPPDMKVRGTMLKHGLKLALRGVLPDSIIDRKKRGFGAPIGAWFKRELSPFLDAVLQEQSIRDRGVFDWDTVQRLRTLHAQSRGDFTDHLLCLMSFELWCQMYLDGDSHTDVSERLSMAAAA